MDFKLTSEQLQLREMVRAYARSEIAPHVSEWDEQQYFPNDIFKGLGKLGLLGVIVPEELGGAGCGYIEYAVVFVS